MNPCGITKRQEEQHLLKMQAENHPSTVGEWIKALSKLDPKLPLFVRCKYTGSTDWTKDCPIYTKGLSQMENGEVGYKHACILY